MVAVPERHLEVNFRRLLHCSEKLAASCAANKDTVSKDDDARLTSYVKVLGDWLDSLRDVAGTPDSTLSEEMVGAYSQTVEKLQEMQRERSAALRVEAAAAATAATMEKDEMATSQSNQADAVPTLGQDPLTNRNLAGPTSLPSTDAMHDKVKEVRLREQQAMREALLGGGESRLRLRLGGRVSSNDPTARTAAADKDALDSALRRQREEQGGLTEDIDGMLSQLRENSRSIQQSLQRDTKCLEDAADLAETNLGSVRKEKGRMAKLMAATHESCLCNTMIAVIVVTLLFACYVVISTFPMNPNPTHRVSSL